MKKIIIAVISIMLIYSCSNSKNKALDTDLDYLYSKALYEFNRNRTVSITNFQQIIERYPYKQEALEAQIFLIWIYYLDQNYQEAEVQIDSFLRYYVYNQYSDWVKYMQALISYEQMGNPQKDQSSAYDAFKRFSDIMAQSKTKQYVRDSALKLEVVKYQIAQRNMIIAKRYLDNKRYLASIKRYQEILVYYQDTVFIEEAMYRLVYIWLLLGDDDEAFRVAAVLSYNYPSSVWYKKSLDLIKQYSKYQDYENFNIKRNPL